MSLGLSILGKFRDIVYSSFGYLVIHCSLVLFQTHVDPRWYGMGFDPSSKFYCDRAGTSFHCVL